MTSVLDGGRDSPAVAISAADIGLVAVSTTLATNALVEGAGRPAALVAIGFESDSLARVGLRAGTGEATSERAGTSPADNGRDRLTGSLASAPVVVVGGGHGAHGDERDPLDLDELARAVDRVADSVEAYAVAAQFSVRNAAHELQARAVIQRAHRQTRDLQPRAVPAARRSSPGADNAAQRTAHLSHRPLHRGDPNGNGVPPARRPSHGGEGRRLAGLGGVS